jgi:redox-sensitive bicupin YhaK (pirin superfamily)
MPEQQSGLMRGFQLWINLPAALKMRPPDYQEYKSATLPIDESAGVRVKVIAGTRGAITGPVKAAHVDARYFDIELAPGAHFEEPLPTDHAAFFAIYEGEAEVPSANGQQAVQALSLVTLGPGEAASLTAGAEGARALLISGRPLREPVAWGGPFVMNTREEVLQAFEDYRQGRF